MWLVAVEDLCVCMCVLVTQSCLTLCDLMDCNPSGSSVHEILQARVLEWVAIPLSRQKIANIPFNWRFPGPHLPAD